MRFYSESNIAQEKINSFWLTFEGTLNHAKRKKKLEFELSASFLARSPHATSLTRLSSPFLSGWFSMSSFSCIPSLLRPLPNARYIS